MVGCQRLRGGDGESCDYKERNEGKKENARVFWGVMELYYLDFGSGYIDIYMCSKL